MPEGGSTRRNRTCPFRIASFVVPVAVYFLAKWTCLELQERGRTRQRAA